jgi:hypothetical protein
MMQARTSTKTLNPYSLKRRDILSGISFVQVAGIGRGLTLNLGKLLIPRNAKNA